MNSLKQLQTRQRTTGFTIVELLIVIVVIAILAATSIVAYNGIQDRARGSAASSLASRVGKRLALYAVAHDGLYPTSLTDTELGLSVAEQSKLQYRYDNTSNPAAYCLTATQETVSYYLNTTTNTVPTKGGCAGHGQGGAEAITNLATNPSFEGNSPLPGGNNNAAVTQTTERVRTGSYSMKITTTADTYSRLIMHGVPSGAGTWTVTAYIYSPVATRIAFEAAGIVTGFDIPASTWTRVTNTGTKTAGTKPVYIGNHSTPSSTVRAQTFYVDDIMITSGSTAYTYADGESLDWVWNGTPNASTSSGPAL